MKGKPFSPKLALSVHTKDRIVASATRLFAQKGYAATSTKEICDDAGANIAAIHYHFESKENLYRHIVKHFTNDSVDRLCQLLRTPKTQDEFVVRLETFLHVSVDSLMRQPEVAKMLLRDMELMTDLCRDVFDGTFLRLHKALVSFLAGARDNHLLRPGIDPGLAALSLNSQILYLSYGTWAMKSLQNVDVGDEAFRDRWMTHILDVLCRGLLKG